MLMFMLMSPAQTAVVGGGRLARQTDRQWPQLISIIGPALHSRTPCRRRRRANTIKYQIQCTGTELIKLRLKGFLSIFLDTSFFSFAHCF